MGNHSTFPRLQHVDHEEGWIRPLRTQHHVVQSLRRGSYSRVKSYSVKAYAAMTEAQRRRNALRSDQGENNDVHGHNASENRLHAHIVGHNRRPSVFNDRRLDVVATYRLNLNRRGRNHLIAGVTVSQ